MKGSLKKKMSFSKLVRFARFCKDIYNRQLLVSNTISTIALLAAGDIMTQYIEVKLKKDSLKLKLTAGSTGGEEPCKSDDKAVDDKQALVPHNHLHQSTMQAFMSQYDWHRSGQ